MRRRSIAPGHEIAVTLCWLAAAQASYPQTIDEQARKQLIAVLSTKLADSYVIGDLAEKMATALRSAEARNEYAGIRDGEALAKRLSDDLRSISQDQHLSVFYRPDKPQTASPSPAGEQPRERYNFGFYRVERLRANIGYLDLRGFSNGKGAEENAAAAMTLLASTDAVIIDLRENGGGSTGAVTFVASYFFPNTVHLTDIYYRDEDRTAEFRTNPSVPGKHLTSQDVYILTSARTWSAAEDFCYALKNLKRATLIGERTAGGAHSGRGLTQLTPGFSAFIPVGRSLSPVTKSNRERVGVEPDISVPAAQAPNEAHIVALRRLLEKELDESWRQNMRETLADLTAKQPR
jgi:hypothetical protein